MDNILEATKIEFNRSLNEAYCQVPREMDMLLNEKLSYWEMRQFMNLIFSQVRDYATKNVVKELLRILTKLEIMNVPIPTIRRQR